MIETVSAIKMMLSDANICHFDITTASNGADHTIYLPSTGRYLLIHYKPDGDLSFIQEYHGSLPTRQTWSSFDDFAKFLEL